MGWFTNFVFGRPEGEQSPAAEVHSEAVSHDAAAVPQDVHRTGDGSKIIPRVDVSRVEPHLSDGAKRLELWIELCNLSSFEVEVKRVEVFGRATDPARFLKPGEKREIRVYQGDTPRDNSRKYASIQYKIVGNGDYFQSDHRIEYKIETADDIEWYVPCELIFVGPVRDI